MLYKIADHFFDIHTLYQEFAQWAKDYHYLGTKSADCTIRVTEPDIERMAWAVARERGAMARGEVLEYSVLNAKVAEYLLPRGYLLFHGSCIEHEGRGYIFTAISGTGKSTHAQLWHQELGASWVNDDKPFLRVAEDGVVMAYGSPWCGKHRRGRNVQIPVANMVILRRGRENSIMPISREEAFPMLYQQTYHPSGWEGIVLQQLARARFHYYALSCNMASEAAQVAYTGIKNNIQG